jgi:hypothetical protein
MEQAGETCGPEKGGDLRLCWRREWQTIACGNTLYTHDGPTKTNPSHDLAHLLIAANGALPWLPLGESRRLAEYNAVFVETLLNNIRWAIVSCPMDDAAILKHTLRHARWFVEKHYAPFPMPAEEAYRTFCWGIDPAVIGRLSPLFFDLRGLEVLASDGLEDGVDIRLRTLETPPAVGAAADFSKRVVEILGAISGRRTTAAVH